MSNDFERDYDIEPILPVLPPAGLLFYLGGESIPRENVLNLVISKKWFDMILWGQKKEEYREIKPYWDKRLSKDYTHVVFRNGYQKDSRNILKKLTSISKGIPDPTIGGDLMGNKECYIIGFE